MNNQKIIILNSLNYIHFSSGTKFFAGKKTTLDGDELAPLLNAKRLNADEVRKAANDWDFSEIEKWRTRQAKRMADFALKLKNFFI